MHVQRSAPSVCYFFLAALSACSSQVQPTYTGEPLGSVEGTIVDPAAPVDRTATSALDVPTVATLPEGAVVAVYWLPGLGDYYSGGGIVHAGGEVPRFKLNFFEPPPDAAMQVEPTGEQAIAYGQLVLLAPGTRTTEPGGPFVQNIWGYSLDSMIVYFARDPRPPTELGPDAIEETAQHYGLPPTRGYHVVRMILGDRAERDLCHWAGRGRCENRATCGRENSRVKLDALRLDFDLCQKALPDAATCWTCPVDETQSKCSGNAGRDCGDFWSFEPNPDDAPIPVTITLGATYRDFSL